MDYGTIAGAQRKPVTTDSKLVFTAPNSPSDRYLVYSDRKILLGINADATQDNGIPVPAETPVLIGLPAGAKLNAVVQDGEVNGYIWVGGTVI